ncbi:MAG: type IV pilus modification PilV family protein [Myxococcota bacterium]
MRTPRTPRSARGFTLLEVLVAMAILAVLMAAITSTQGSSLLHGARVYNLTTATQLLDGVVLDLEEEYRLEGFPENSLEGRECELPRDFDLFRCEYDLVALDVGADNISSLGEAATETVTESPLMSVLCSGAAGAGGAQQAGSSDDEGEDGQMDPQQALDQMGMQSAALGALRTLVDPQFAQLCNMNIAKMCQNMPMFASFIPTIIEQAARSTRKLRIRLSWAERGRAEKTIEVETFIVSVPEAEQEDQQQPK